MTYDPKGAAMREVPAPITAPEPPAPAATAPIRFRAEPKTLKAALEWAGFVTHRPRGSRIEQTYFDTSQGALAGHSMALHLRKQGRRHLLTLEARGEFNQAKLDGPVPAHEAFGPETAAQIHEILDGEALQPVFTAALMRVLRRAETPAAVIEFAFDSGAIRNLQSSLPVSEVTLALKSGDPAELYRVGLEFAAMFPVRLGWQSLAARGAQLISGTPPTAPKADTGLHGAPAVDTAISAFITACMRQFTDQIPVFEQGDAPRAVHQLRVALRRLRSVLGVFQRAFPCAEFAAYRNQAKAMAATLGQAREWDVFLTQVGQGPRLAFPDEPGFTALLNGAEAVRAAGYARVATLLNGPEMPRFVLGLQGFAARHGWRNAVAGEALPALAAPADAFGRLSLARQHRKISRAGKHLASLPSRQRHELRKQLKKLRYTAEFFGGQGAALLKTAAALQDRLGAANDAAGAITLAASLQDGEAATARAAGMVMGWCGRSGVADEAALRKAWKKFRRAKLLK